MDEEDVAQVVAKWTGVPVSKMLEGEMQKLVTMEERLRHRVIGQDEALTAVANAVRRARAGLQDPNRPVGSFIFLGPTGVGKTETARALAEFLFDDERSMIRLDMSRVHGEARRGADDRRAAGLRRLRGGRPVDRGRQAPPLQRHPLRRDREGAPGRLQHPLADSRRRPPDRLEGAHRGLQEHGAHHDLESGQPRDTGRGRRREAGARGRASKSCASTSSRSS